MFILRLTSLLNEIEKGIAKSRKPYKIWTGRTRLNCAGHVIKNLTVSGFIGRTPGNASYKKAKAKKVSRAVRFQTILCCMPFEIELVLFRNFVYVSTAFSHATEERVRRPVLEQFYPCPMPPELVIGMAETMDEHRLENLTEE